MRFEMFVLALTSHKGVFPRCGNGTIILRTMNFCWSPATFGGSGPAKNSRRVGTPEEPPQACQVEKSARVEQIQPFRAEPGTTDIPSLPVLLSIRPPQPRIHNYENVNPYGHLDHPAAPRGPTRPEAANKGETEWPFLQAVTI